MLMHGLLRDGAERHPERDGFHWVDRQRGLSYGAAATAMAHMAGALHHVGVRPGDRVSIVAHNGLDYLTAMFGCWQLGAIAALVNVKFAPDLAYYFADHTPSAVIYTHDLHDEVCAAASAVGGVRALICMDGAMPGALSLPELMSGAFRAPDFARDETAIAHLAYTSGTTGRPKGACLRHEPTTTAARVIAERLRLSRNDISFGPTALSSSYQLVGNLLPPLAVGAPVNVMGRWTAQTGPAALEARAATVLVANPIVLADLLTHVRATGQRPATLRLALSGGGAVPQALKRAFATELELPLVESYGQSELGGFVALGFPTLADSDGASRRIGPPLPDKEVRIRDLDDRILPPGEVGEIVLRGGYMAGYWNRPDKTSEVLRDGWLCTGDIGFIDRDGFVTMLGRRSELIRVGDRSWYPRDIEDVLAELPGIAMAALIATGPATDLAPLAVLVLHPGAVLDEPACRAALGARTSYDIDRLGFAVVSEMPMTPTGKIARAELALRFGAGTDTLNDD